MRRSAGVLALVALIILLVSGVSAAEVLTNDAIVSMVKAGLGEDLIIGKVRTTEGKYDLSTDGILKLKGAGVSEPVIMAMLEVSAPPVSVQPRSAPATAKDVQDAVALYRQGKGVEAAAAFDKLLAEQPNDDGLRIWKALSLLEQARAIRDAGKSGYQSLVRNAYALLQPLKLRQSGSPEWNLAMGRAFWLNDRPTWASRAASAAAGLRRDFAEAQLLLADLAYDAEFGALNASAADPRRDTARQFAGTFSRKEYEKVLNLPDLPGSMRAEALYKLGLVAAVLEGKPDSAREHWERAAAAAPACRYGFLAQDKLKAGRGK